MALKVAPNNAELWFSYAVTLGEEAEAVARIDVVEARGLWLQAGSLYTRALGLDPKHDRAANSWGLDLAAEAKAVARLDLAAARQLWRQAGKKYALALHLLPNKHGSANNWGNALADEAKAIAATNLAEAQVLWDAARDKYRWALRIKPDKFNAMSNWGSASAVEAEALAADDQWPEAETLWQEAGERYEAALQLSPKFESALYSYGATLSSQAELVAPKDIGRAGNLWQRARKFYARTLEVNPGHFSAALNWAVSLEVETKARQDVPEETAAAMWDKVIDRYQSAIRINSRSEEGYTGLGNGFDHGARLLAKAGKLDAARRLWREAESAYARSLQIKPGLLAAKNWGVALQAAREYAGAADAAGSRALLQAANARFAAASSLWPRNAEFYHVSGLCYRYEYDLALSTGAEMREQRELLQLAQRQFAAAAQLENCPVENWGAWGVALLFEARLIQWQDVVRMQTLLDDAAAKLKEAVRRDQNNFSDNYNLAVVYHSIANIEFPKNWDVALDYYRRTETQCLRTLELSPGEVNSQLLLVHALASQAAIMTHRDMPATLELCRRADAIFNLLEKRSGIEGQNTWDWANALAREAYALAWPDLPRALRLFDVAAEKFEQAHAAGENQAKILLDWGKMLGSKAQGLAWKGGLPSARQAWKEARDRFAAKQRMEPGMADASVEIGLTLLREYASLPAGDRTTNQALLDEAEKAQLAAEAISPGLGAYNLACVYAWRNRPGECVSWLEQARKSGRLPARSYVLGDPFLGLVAKSAEFARWLDTAYLAR